MGKRNLGYKMTELIQSDDFKRKTTHKQDIEVIILIDDYEKNAESLPEVVQVFIIHQLRTIRQVKTRLLISLL